MIQSYIFHNTRFLFGNDSLGENTNKLWKPCPPSPFPLLRASSLSKMLKGTLLFALSFLLFCFLQTFAKKLRVAFFPEAPIKILARYFLPCSKLGQASLCGTDQKLFPLIVYAAPRNAGNGYERYFGTTQWESAEKVIKHLSNLPLSLWVCVECPKSDLRQSQKKAITLASTEEALMKARVREGPFRLSACPPPQKKTRRRVGNRRITLTQIQMVALDWS